MTARANTSADLADRIRGWLVDNDRDATPATVAAALNELGVVAETRVHSQLVQQLQRELDGAGPLQTLLDQPGLSDVLVNGAGAVWVDRGMGLQRVAVNVGDEDSVRRLAQRLAAQAGRRLDDAQPFVDARLPGGVRLHAALAPIASPGTTISLRTPAHRSFSLAELQQAGAISAPGVQWLHALIAARLSFLVIGGTGSGKTTVLRCLLEQVPAAERILVVEESAELRPSHDHCVALEGRPHNAEGIGGVELSQLVRQAMRMRPDRIVVGEVRGAEVVQLLAAMNTGHEGCAGTIHANSPQALPARVEALAGAAGLDRPRAHSQLAAGLEAVVHLRRDSDGHRRVVELGVVVVRQGLSRVVSLVTFTDDRPILHLPNHPAAKRLLAALAV
ncbi:MAG: TadA family conjugal transfer-associated ATPase [Actinomycetia bacterium]|nr:TadA family conjugal transfer-associated ATPase [Actinomycetes bacterium]MCH9800159.1 TadA family conjugal transfer-associated ATPase [Actinomycetes bacterium]